MARMVEVRTELESILVEQALAMARELEAVSDAAPDGPVLAVAEMAAVRLGRELTRAALEAALSARPGRPSKGGPRPGLPLRRAPPHQGQGAQDGGDRRRAGRADPPLAALPPVRPDGLPGRRPRRPRRLPQPRATRLACLAAASWSFDVASERLEEIAGLRIDDETIRRHVHRAAAGLAARREAEPPRRPSPPPRASRVPHRRRDGPDPRRLARAEAGPLPGPARRRAGRGGGLGRPRAARADGERRLCDDGRLRGVLGPVGRLGRGAGDRPGRRPDGAGRRGGLDLGGGRRALPGGRPGAGHLPRRPAHRRGGRRPLRRGDARGGRLAGAGAGRAAGRRLAGAAGPRRRHADGGADALGPGGDR